jgi:hypothetical protein
MPGPKRKLPCEHGLTDACEVTDQTVISDFRHGSRTAVTGYWCREHQAFGSWAMRERIPRRVLTGPDAPHQALELP